MKILQVSTMDIAGGAEKVAFNLFKSYQELGHQSWLAVGFKRGADARVVDISSKNAHSLPTQTLLNLRDWLRIQNQSFQGTWRLSDLVDWLAQPGKRWDNSWGIEDFHFPGSRRLLNLVGDAPNIIHAHNLHGGFFDLRYLSKLSKQVPVVFTLHDEWMLTGHCAYTMGCERWKHGCGSCPDLTIYPMIKKDSTAYNWKRKENIYKQSNLYIATPSQWLMDRVQHSMLRPIESRVIPNGVDLRVYYPGKRASARHELGLPRDAKIILGSASRSRFKDYETVKDAVGKLSDNEALGTSSVIFIALGSDENEAKEYGNVQIKNVNFVFDPAVVAKYFQAADVFLHAAQAENFPNTILESFACGTPVIATSVGGIPEQIEEGINGFLVPKGDSHAMADRIIQLLTDDSLRAKMGRKASNLVREKFGLELQAKNYLTWYEEILEKHALSYSE